MLKNGLEIKLTGSKKVVINLIIIFSSVNECLVLLLELNVLLDWTLDQFCQPGACLLDVPHAHRGLVLPNVLVCALGPVYVFIVQKSANEFVT